MPQAISNDIQLAAGEHVVQFYASDATLVDVVGRVLGAALVGGDVAVVIATPVHVHAFRGRFRALGIDVDSVERDGRLAVRDAAELLTTFMTDSGPDQGRFHQAIDELVGPAVRAGQRVWAFGEMVGILWADGNALAALELEGLWDELVDELGLSLLCAYPHDLFAATGQAEGYLAVCRAHGHVLAGAPVLGEPEVLERLPATLDAPGRARVLVADTLQAWDRPDLASSCRLVVSELVANAVRYGGSELTVALARHDGAVRISVGDMTQAAPELPEVDRGALGGRGIRLVSQLARAWGYERSGNGKVVWATIDDDRMREHI